MTNALALAKHALDQCAASLPGLSSVPEHQDQSLVPQSIAVTTRDAESLHSLLSSEVLRLRALVEISAQQRQETASNRSSAVTFKPPPLMGRLAEYPAGGVDLDNLVVFPPRVELVPVKPLFLDVAWSYMGYPSKERQPSGPAAAAETDAKPQKKGWFGFGR